MDWSVRRIHRIKSLAAGQSYLEIGVDEGNTFFNVDIALKDGVDPHFRFNADERKTQNVRLFEVTSDSFWTSNLPRENYDVIMIDGLHTFEQTIRDLICSMRYAHKRTIWLLDDTLPSDVFSAIPNMSRSFKERQKMKIPGEMPWHGDVFKLVPAIHDFFPTLNYATIVGSGNPQTLLWYGKRDNFKPVFYNFEVVSRLTYFDIERIHKIFNFVDEDKAFENLANAQPA